MEDKSEEKVRHELYLKYHEANEKIKLANGEAYDKAILTLSSAGLALSLSFVKFIVPIGEANSVGYLTCSLYSFLVAIISTVLSFRIAQWGYDVAIEHAEKFYLEANDEYAEKINLPAACSEYLNWISAAAFILAMISIVQFILNNIKV